MRIRILVIAGAMALALGLVGVALTLAHETVPTQPTAQVETDESRREAEAAAAREANPRPSLRSATVFTPPAVISGPVFLGVDDSILFTYVLDPETAENHPLFDGFEVWGAAYDPDNRRVLIADGSTLVEWPLDGAPVALGSMTGSDSGAVVAMVGLAYADGTLYSVRNVSTPADPEGIYTIDTTTREATLFTTYTAPAGTIDIGGLAADPATGELYGTNDGATSNGLVRINSDGDLTLVAPYPDDQTDVDGLAIGDGRAYLVTDQPGFTYVYDFATMTYTVPITNPWTTGEIFAGATWIEDSPPNSISLTKTVGTDPNVCATTTELALPAAGEVTYCYEVTNTGGITVTRHDLEDSELGSLLTDFPYTLAPSASAFLTATTQITQTTVNTATWTSYNPGPADVVTATAAATVTVSIPEPAISLTKTVGTDPNVCAPTSAITVPPGTQVVYCYRVANTGGVTLTLHNLEDSALGILRDGLAYSLTVGADFFITQTAEITQTTINTATWTAYNPDPTDVVTATAAATVTVSAALPEIVVDPASLAVQLAADDQTTRTLTISNTGAADLAWMISFAPDDCAEPGVLLWASVDPLDGTTTPGGAGEVTVTFDALGQPEGESTGVLCVSSNDADEPVVAVPLSLTVGPDTGPALLRLPIIIGSPLGGTRSR